MRCTECGDVRWSIMGFADHAPTECEICGAEMVPERRMPNHAATLEVERRSAQAPLQASHH